MHWFFDAELSNKSTQLPEAEAKHASSSLRIRVGEKIAVTNGSGLVGLAEVLESGKSSLSYSVISIQEHERTSPAIHLVQALSKGDRDELALQACVEIGVDQVMPWEAERSVVRWGSEKKSKGLARWQQIAIESMKQSQQAYLCKVDSMFEMNVPLSGRTIVLEPSADKTLASMEFRPNEEINLIVGPEGGISEAELKAFGAMGYQVAKLGNSVLRASTAGPVAVSVIRTMLRNW
jgi:16S rRNA (uracil1498-N3)-methyltransferase